MKVENYVPIIHKWLAWQEYISDSELIIFDNKNNQWYVTSNIGKEIWLLIDEEKTVFDIAEKLNKIYKTEKKIILNDVIDFLKKIEKQGLIKFRVLERGGEKNE